MNKVEIFEPAVSGIGVDQDRLRLLAFINTLEAEGKKITQYNFSKQPQAFVNNKHVNDALISGGIQGLPITMVNGEIKKKGSYPSNLDLASWAGMTRDELVMMILRSQMAAGGRRGASGGGCCGPSGGGC